MVNAPGKNAIANLAARLQSALDDAQDAVNKGDQQARGYAEGAALRLKREIAKLDPRGAGYQYLSLLSDGERVQALTA